eukprot:TRINITY_DN19857_c0_g1_i1.p1 TRINITY_DN19857_c0_g1~~TRINITY_DN19857_c0_g1_i1.p1  ORF type:complete len:234 (-),score=70.15 TRINITY_DN19857_c0_g1_i1:124-825(-)
MATKPMENDKVNEQLKNMKAFILDEAEEKRNEIKTKSKEEFQIEKSSYKHAEIEKLKAEFEERAKEKETERKITVSNQLNAARLRVLKSRDDIIAQVREESRQQLGQISSGENYRDLLQKLIVQGCLKMREPELLVRCREVDQALVKGVLSSAADEYKRLTQSSVNLRIDSQFLPAPPTKDTDLSLTHRYCSGGIVLSAKEGRILCNNTLDQRLNLAFDAKIPELRRLLFQTS